MEVNANSPSKSNELAEEIEYSTGRRGAGIRDSGPTEVVSEEDEYPSPVPNSQSNNATKNSSARQQLESGIEMLLRNI